MNLRIPLLLVVLSVLSACVAAPSVSPETAESQPALDLDTSDAVAKYLSGRDLDPVEGAWVHEDDAFEIVISKNTFNIETDYDYVGILTRVSQGTWKKGEVKLLLQGAPTSSSFKGVWLTHNKDRQEMLFVVENRNLIQASFVDSDGETFFVRIRRMKNAIADNSLMPLPGEIGG